MNNTVISKNVNYILNLVNWPSKGTLVVAISGGPDSVGAMRILYEVAQLKGFRLHLAHLDHCLRGEESAQDAQYVASLAESLGLEYTIGSEDIKSLHQKQKGSIQQVCREVRQEFLQKVASKTNAFGVAFGHNKNDQAETVLQHLLRGCGLAGLIGMKEVETLENGIIIVRPVMHMTRSEIVEMLNYWQLKYRHDPSNDTDKYQRNHIRHHLIPYLKQHYNLQITDRLVDMSKVLSVDNEYLHQQTKTLACKAVEERLDAIIVNCDELINQHKALIIRLMRYAYQKLRGNVDNLTYEHSESLFDLTKSEHGDSISLPGGVKCEKIYNQIFFYYQQEWEKHFAKKNKIEIIVNEKTAIDENRLLYIEELNKSMINQLNNNSSFEVYFDKNRIKTPLYIRTRKAGDRFHPYGSPGGKKLKDFFIDQKIPRYLRDKQQLLVDSDDKILWIIGLRRSAYAKVTKTTQIILKCRIMEE